MKYYSLLLCILVSISTQAGELIVVGQMDAQELAQYRIVRLNIEKSKNNPNMAKTEIYQMVFDEIKDKIEKNPSKYYKLHAPKGAKLSYTPCEVNDCKVVDGDMDITCSDGASRLVKVNQTIVKCKQGAACKTQALREKLMECKPEELPTYLFQSYMHSRNRNFKLAPKREKPAKGQK